MCGCLVALAAFISPRLAIFFIWLFGDRMSIAFDSFWWGFLGFIFLPWTTLAWTVAYVPIQGVTGFGWFLVIFAFLVDIGTHIGSAQARRDRAPHGVAMIPIGWFGVGSGAYADPESVALIAQTAEALGYDSIWVGEHPVLIDPHEPPSPLPPHSELMDPIPVLAYAAATTERILLGTGIVILPLRNPVILAKELATIDVLSRGRLVVGIGVGYVPGEYEAIGVPFDTPGHRTDEWIDSLRTLWHDDQPEFRGDFASFGGIQCRPRPHRPGGPPILGSGMATAARRRSVSRCDGWYGFYLDLDNTRAALAELDQLAGEVDRPAELGPLEITITPPPGPIDVDTVRRYEDLGVDRLVVLQDFGDMAGGPDPARRGKFVDEMTACAERLDIR